MRKTIAQLRLVNKGVSISVNKEKEILEYFKTQKDNRMSVVAKHFEVSEYQVGRILDNHFNVLKIKANESLKSKE